MELIFVTSGRDAGCPGATFSWTACVDDDCPVHLSDKQEAVWFPRSTVGRDDSEDVDMDLDLAIDFDEAASDEGKDSVEGGVDHSLLDFGGQSESLVDFEASVRLSEGRDEEDGELDDGGSELSEREQVRSVLDRVAILVMCILVAIDVVLISFVLLLIL